MMADMERSGEDAMVVCGQDIPRQLTWIFKFRLFDIAALLILEILNSHSVFLPDNHNVITPPEVEITFDGTTATLEDPEYSFPLKVDGNWCTAADFEACGGELSSSGCCADQGFQATVPSKALYWLLVYIPLAFIVLRYLFMRAINLKAPATRLADSVVALLTTWFIVTTLTHWAKEYIGYPRPNYYALIAYAELHSKNGPPPGVNESCPSGHASDTMGGMAFLSLYLLRDLRRLGQRRWRRLAPSPPPPLPPVAAGDPEAAAGGGGGERAAAGGGGGGGGNDVRGDWGLLTPCSALAAYALALAPFLVAGYVGATRVADHFHSPADVLAGWAVGLAGAAAGVHAAAPARARHRRRRRRSSGMEKMPQQEIEITSPFHANGKEATTTKRQ